MTLDRPSEPTTVLNRAVSVRPRAEARNNRKIRVAPQHVLGDAVSALRVVAASPVPSAAGFD